MSVNVEAMFSGMDQAQMFGGGQWFAAGSRFQLKTKSLKAQNGFKGPAFIAEFEIVAADPSNPKNEDGSPIDPVGATRSWVVMLGSKNRNAFGDIKGLMFAISGKNPATVAAPEQNPALHAEISEAVKMACDESYAKSKGVASSAFVGLSVNLETFAKPTKATADRPNGGTFTKHIWTPAATTP